MQFLRSVPSKGDRLIRFNFSTRYSSDTDIFTCIAWPFEGEYKYVRNITACDTVIFPYMCSRDITVCDFAGWCLYLFCS